MKIKVRYIKDVAVIEADGKVNINSSRLIEAVGSILEEGVTNIVLDMHKVDIVDYNGLSVLAIAYKSALNQKGSMKLCGISLHILELLRVVKLDEVFDIYSSLKEAVDSFRRKKASKMEILEQPLRRRFKRLDIDIPVHFRLSKGSPLRGEPLLYTGRIANISGAGIFIRTINIFPPGSGVDMEIALKKGKKSRSISGVVLWLADKGLQPDLYPGMGVAFPQLSHRTQEEIIEFIEKNTVHRRGKI